MVRDSDATMAARAALDYLVSWIEYRVWRTRTPGAQVAIWFGGALRMSKAFGVADVTTGERLTATHQFRVASHSKMLAATVVLQLVEQGRLRLDDAASVHVPQLLGTGAEHVTIRELLSHGAGITRDSADSTFWSLQRPFPDALELDAILAEPLDVVPSATRFKYSNVGYGVLGLVVEAVTGSRYEDAVRERIVRPLGLTRTVPDVDARKSAKHVASHSGLLTSMTRGVLESPTSGSLAAATGVTSTAAELARFAAAHFLGSGELLEDRTKRWMAQQHWSTIDRDGVPAGYGLGLQRREIAGRTWLGHGGAWPGQLTRTLFEPRLGMAVSVLTNAIDGPAAEIAEGIVEILMATQRRDVDDLAMASGHDVPEHGSASMEPVRGARRVDLMRFTGRFQSPWSLLDVVRLGDALYAIPPSATHPMAQAQRLTVLDETTLRVDDDGGFGAVGEPIRYEFDARGSVRRITGGWRMEPARSLEAYRQDAAGVGGRS
ncbi:serine hydrolase domain-containing protein [Agrococcus sp. SGAir0287]|uniref:serine hydrolase domain-containing protein n=1 Tax=Agrococcus sp. SGAir0287 TaxID=2070347 RepID=UPI0010CD275A|nr:serine hydrolase domain-containing protein [Agrococcus sp. SGAir0287]QCR19281.1 serine hydrolase [Agrococcus sp. SGAir0287]